VDPEPVSMIWRTEKSPCFAGIRTPDHPASSLIKHFFYEPCSKRIEARRVSNNHRALNSGDGITVKKFTYQTLSWVCVS
jgi:hypothetical protein